MISVVDKQSCMLGEGAFWHPLRNQLYWFDILDKKLFTLENKKTKFWQFEEYVSAAGWIDMSTLIIAGENNLFLFNIETSERKDVCDLEKNQTSNRSNDGCADPWGGFWISTMGKKAEFDNGAIYRFYKNKLVKLFENLTIPNSICFSEEIPAGYFSDTNKQIIYRQELNRKSGWPEGEKEIFFDLSNKNLNPDGMTIDKDGNLWCALWGSSQLISISKFGHILDTFKLSAKQPTCPSFGGNNLNSIFLTSASVGLRDKEEADGQTFKIDIGVQGKPEFKVKL